MNRTHTRNLVRQVAQDCDPQAALSLYDQSIASGHKRIALLRYLDARDLSVPLTPQHHAYARAVASVLSERDMEIIAREALRRSRERQTLPALTETERN
ncbi:hypothetical protein LMG27952_04109 [Paraburkholderia hiiakae]|uniref:Sel1 repeat-containing protein n=1 Tax=Paraburkholderia hiiakae TaxID=1081782 RepID=A0ABM8NUF9_9BURK|nr:hypothetical protein [Paraburkholderia hiiakae]CAD6543935.1 hypothetical protein LMG27952_04109 [Paraburkholderia hiiakae]